MIAFHPCDETMNSNAARKLVSMIRAFPRMFMRRDMLLTINHSEATIRFAFSRLFSGHRKIVRIEKLRIERIEKLFPLFEIDEASARLQTAFRVTVTSNLM